MLDGPRLDLILGAPGLSLPQATTWTAWPPHEMRLTPILCLLDLGPCEGAGAFITAGYAEGGTGGLA